MKSIRFLFFILLFGPSIPAFSNPIVPPPMILEIWFGPEGWQIELMNNEFSGEESLDNVWLYGLFDSAHFVPGIEFLPGELVVVTQDDLMTPMTIDQSGDHLRLFYIEGNYDYFLDMVGLFWGVWYAEVSAPAGEESVAYQWFDLPESDWGYWAAKELPNTIGYNPWQISKKATFSGYVLDKNDKPLENIYLDYCYSSFYFYSDPTVPIVHTISDGSFHTDGMYCKEYHINFTIDLLGPIIGDTTISLEPDSANYFEFKLDTLLTGINENNPPEPYFAISCFPNPSSSRTTFIIASKHPNTDLNGVIKIYSDNGYIVDIVPVILNDIKQELVYDLNKKSLSSGLYFYNLEIRNHKVASGKMIISL